MSASSPLERAFTLLGLTAALAMGACQSADRCERPHGPRVVPIEDPTILPMDLTADRHPVVHIATQELDRQQMDLLGVQMRQRGFVYVGAIPYDSSAYVEHRFFGGYAEVFHTFPDSHAWLASKALCAAGIPFGWGISQGQYLYVPAAFADQARSVLERDPRLRPRVLPKDPVPAEADDA